jgi:hypothetical protein
VTGEITRNGQTFYSVTVNISNCIADLDGAIEKDLYTTRAQVNTFWSNQEIPEGLHEIQTLIDQKKLCNTDSRDPYETFQDLTQWVTRND